MGGVEVSPPCMAVVWVALLVFLVNQVWTLFDRVFKLRNGEAETTLAAPPIRKPSKPAPAAAAAAPAQKPKESQFDDQSFARQLEEAESFEASSKPDKALQALETAGRIPYAKVEVEDPIAKSTEFYNQMNGRRSLRVYSPEKFPIELLENAIHTAGTSPSGANLQPWSYVVVENQEAKAKIRELVENEEKVNYERRMKRSWVEDLKHLGTDWQKEYLTEAPYIVCVFKHAYRPGPDGEKFTVYYPEQSVGISVGFFMAALWNVGLTTLTSTPMGAEAGIRDILGRGAHERLYLLMPVGYPAEGATVPNITRKPLDEVMATV